MNLLGDLKRIAYQAMKYFLLIWNDYNGIVILNVLKLASYSYIRYIPKKIVLLAKPYFHVLEL